MTGEIWVCLNCGKQHPRKKYSDGALRCGCKSRQLCLDGKVRRIRGSNSAIICHSQQDADLQTKQLRATAVKRQ